MNIKLETALNNVEQNYGELVEIANDILEPVLQKANSLITNISNTGYNMSVDQIRDSMLGLQLCASNLSDIREKAAMKADLAVSLQKERYAIEFNSMDGSAAVKDKLALVAVSPEIASQTLYSLVSSIIKAKVDQLHRLVDVLKSILMSRMQETKFMNIGSTIDIPATTGQAYQGRVILNEG